jgi:cyclase
MYKRIIGVILLDGGVFCRTRNFSVDYHYTNKFIDSHLFDELIFLNVSHHAKGEDRARFSAGINEIVLNSQLPVSIGGGIKGPREIEEFRKFGADRYVINQTTSDSDSLVSNLIDEFGKSSIISSINHWGPYTASREGATQIKVVDRVKEIKDNCGGDILINSIERDGTLRGLDLTIIDELAQLVDCKFILAGGLGNVEHLFEGLKRDNVVGVCTSNVYHLTTNTISNWRTELFSRGIEVRKM